MASFYLFLFFSNYFLTQTQRDSNLNVEVEHADHSTTKATMMHQTMLQSAIQCWSLFWTLLYKLVCYRWRSIMWHQMTWHYILPHGITSRDIKWHDIWPFSHISSTDFTFCQVDKMSLWRDVIRSLETFSRLLTSQKYSSMIDICCTFVRCDLWVVLGPYQWPVKRSFYHSNLRSTEWLQY